MEDDCTTGSDDRMDIASEDVTSSTTNTAHEPRQQQNDGAKDEKGTSRHHHHQQQQQQAQNLDTWLQLIETAIQPFQPPNQVVPINSKSNNYTRTPPQYLIQHGILSSKSNHRTEVVGSSMVKVVTTSPPTSSINTNTNNTTTTTTTSIILIATVTLQVGQPSIMTPKQGDIMVTLVQGSSSSGSNSSMTNAHGIHAIQSKLQRVLDENMDLEQLHVIEGKIAYRLVVTVTILFVESITCLTFFDACLVAAIAALLDTKLPTRPLVHDGVLYNNSITTTSLSSTDTASGDSSSDPTIEQKPLYMPILPISFTAVGVRFPVDTIVSGKNDKETKTLHWIGDPTMDEQLLSESTVVATIVMNAAAAITTNMKNDEEEEEDILCLQLTPNTTTTAAAAAGTTIHPTLTASNVVPTMTTTAVVVSCHDVDTVVSMARRHVQSMYTLLQPK